MSVRRLLLDPILVEAAAEAGADIRMGTKVSGLLEDRGRVTGVRAVTDGEQVGLRARLVVGADGRNSTVAGLCGSLKYNVTPNQRAFYWSFFEDADLKGEPTFVLHRWRDRFILGCPTDSGLYQVLVAPEAIMRRGFPPWSKTCSSAPGGPVCGMEPSTSKPSSIAWRPWLGCGSTMPPSASPAA